MKKAYESLSVAINALREEGYTCDFNLKEKGLKNDHRDTFHEPRDLKVVAYYRFEGKTNPGDSSVLYVIEAANGEKGLLVDAYGAYSGQISQEMLDKLNMDKH